MGKVTKIVLIMLLASLLVLIRGYEDTIFYDPLISFFKLQSTQPFPEFNTFKLLANIAMRYFFNTLISLGILWLIFQKRDVIKLSAVLYGIVFIVLIAVYYFLLSASDEGQYMTLFYVRRFLIQPLFLLILIPAFYFQKNT
jgi:exosortase F-associated protein